MSYKKGKFVYKSDYSTKTTPTTSTASHNPSPRKRKRSSSFAQDDEKEEEDEYDQLLAQAVDNYEQSQAIQDPFPCTPDPLPIRNTPTHNYMPLSSSSKATRPDEDKMMAIEGENTLLRVKLRQAEEKLSEREHETTTQIQLVKEQQKRETESLKADLAFKNQEIQSLLEKCRTLESSKTQSSTLSRGQSDSTKGQSIGMKSHSDSLKGHLVGAKGHSDSAKGHSLSTKGRSTISSPLTNLTNGSSKTKTEFVSSETFIPPSQVAGSKITQVPSTNKKKRSRSASHTHHASKSTSRGSQTELYIDRPYQALQSHDINGAQLMRLLLQRNLLSIPDYKSLEAKLDNNEDSEEEEDKDMSEPLGLLSLLPIPTATTPSPFVSSPQNSQEGDNFTVTPVNRHCIETKLFPRANKITPKLPFKRPLSFLSNNISTPNDTSPVNQFIMSSLQDSFSRLLRSADLPSLSSFSSSTRMPHFSFDSLSQTALKALQSTTSDNGVSLLPSFESILDIYLQEQILYRKRQKRLERLVSSLEEGRITIDSSSGPSSSGNSENVNNSSTSPPTQLSRSSSDELTQEELFRMRFFDRSQTPNSIHQKKQVLQVALSLETLCKYSSQVRAAIISKPPHFNYSDLGSIRDPGSSSSEGEESSDGEARVKDVCELFKTKKKTTLKNESDMIPLSCFVGDIVSNRVYVKKEQVDPGNDLTPPTVDSSKTFKHPIYTGNIFDVLIGLVHNIEWEKDLELLLSILDSLAVLASDCPIESLERRESVVVSLLLLENPEVTLRVVSLMVPLAKSPVLVKLFCNNTSMCPLDHFYALFVPRAVVSLISLRTKIEQQLTRFICQLTLIPEGELVLYESECCSHQLLKSLAGSLLNLLDDLKTDELKQDIINRNKRITLAKSMVRLLHVICNKDKLIGEHKAECYHVFLTALSKSHDLLTGSDVDELLLDLLECEGIIEEEEEEEEEEEGNNL